MSPRADALDLIAIDKAFGAVRANRGATLTVPSGEIHALVGENGAGKSTLARIACGALRPDAGTVRVHGRDVTGWSITDAIAAGVGLVHQHFMLVPTLTVAENLVLGREPALGPALRLGRAAREVRELGEATGLAVDPTRRVAELSVGEAQRVEILKVLYRGATVLVLDEPTAVLTPPEVEQLWTVLRALRAQGSTVVIITHKLDEVMAISDAVTVMRDGQTVARVATADTTPGALARAMVGHDIVESRPPRAPTTHTRAVLEVRDLVTRGVDGVSFTVAPGEIFGIAGVEGNGQTELIEAIAGLRPVERGTIALFGRPIDRESVRRRAEMGIAHIPEDRHRRGLVLDYSVADNLILGRERSFGRWRLRRGDVRHEAERLIEAFDIRPADPAGPARSLSGGNQQKIVVAREMAGIRVFDLLLAAQPTRGVDVGAVETIHAQLRMARAEGRAVVLMSAELSELLSLADRIAVMLRGRFVATVPRADADIGLLGRYMAGVA
jgi:general nucleoside transport system ATP-binding protein